MATVHDGARKKRVPLSPNYGSERYLVALLNLGGVDVTAKAIAAEMSRLPSDVYDALVRAIRVGRVTVKKRPTFVYSLTSTGRMAAIHASPDIAEWKARYEAGESDEMIAAKEGHPPHRVRQALSDAGVTLRQRPHKGAK